MTYLLTRYRRKYHLLIITVLNKENLKSNADHSLTRGICRFHCNLINNDFAVIEFCGEYESKWNAVFHSKWMSGDVEHGIESFESQTICQHDHGTRGVKLSVRQSNLVTCLQNLLLSQALTPVLTRDLHDDGLQSPQSLCRSVCRLLCAGSARMGLRPGSTGLGSSDLLLRQLRIHRILLLHGFLLLRMSFLRLVVWQS